MRNSDVLLFVYSNLGTEDEKMFQSYRTYINEPKSLTIEKMQQLHEEILNEIGNDEDAKELYGELIETATRYADFRAQWCLWNRETKMERDESRTACHNSTIIKFNMLARYLKMQGKEAKWRDELGYIEDDSYNRKTIGDFACYLVFVNSINAR